MLWAQQCNINAPVAVFDSMENIMGATFNFTAVPTGTAIKIYVPFTPASLTFDMCSANNQGDSYLTLLNENSSNPSVVGFADDGCPVSVNLTYESILITGPGTYYLYVTDFPCIGNGATSYDIEITSAVANYPNNDICEDAMTLPLNTLIQSTFSDRGYDVNGEEHPATGDPISNTCEVNSTETTSLVWFKFFAPQTSTYMLRLANVSFSSDFLYYDYAIYPVSDLVCGDMAASNLSRGICRSSSQGVQGTLDTSLVTLEQGEYYIVVSKRFDPVDFSIRIEDRGYTDACGTEAVPAMSYYMGTSPCATENGSVYLSFDSNVILPAVGNAYGLFGLFGSGPINNFQRPYDDPNFYAIGRIFDYEGLELVGSNFTPGNYYLYLLATANGLVSNGEYTFDTACMERSAIVFKILAQGDTACILGINDIEMPTFNIYPNPTNSLLNIEVLQNMGFQSYTIYNAMGKTCQVGVPGTLQGTSSVDVSLLPQGYYLFTVSSADGQKYTKPFLITR